MGTGSTDTRGVSPVVGTVLLVGIAVILSATIAGMVLNADTQENAPSAAFETEQGEYLQIRHDSGETIDRSKLEVKGGEAWQVPAEVTSGTEIEVNPDSGVDEVKLIWKNDDTSYVLQSFETGSVEAGPEPMPPQPRDCNVVTADPGSGSITNPGGCVRIAEDVDVDSSVNIEQTDRLYLESGSSVNGPVDVNNDVVVYSGAEINDNVNNGENVFIGEDAEITGKVGDSSADYVVVRGSINGQIQTGTDEVYVRPGGAIITGGVKIQPDDIYLKDTSQVPNGFKAGATVHKEY